MSRRINVRILTFCKSLDSLYGNELVFKTLRVGFPTARVLVVDNDSVPEARDRLEALARDAGCEFVSLEGREVGHHRFLEDTIRSCANDESFDGPLVFLDPDMCFWESCEDFAFSGLMAGLRCRPIDDPITQTRTAARLHTSFLWIEDPRALWQAICEIRRVRFDFQPFQPMSFVLSGTWHRLDTGASLCAAIPEDVSGFTNDHHRRYDHIYAGSHLDWIVDKCDETVGTMLRQVHGCAKRGDLEALRGIRLYQEAVLARSWRTAVHTLGGDSDE